MTFGEMQMQARAWKLTDQEMDEVMIFRGSGEEFQATRIKDLIERSAVLANAAGMSLDLLAAEVEVKRKKRTPQNAKV